ncbi:hypothetical protein FT663_04840 [Candidozyma haemuli var. vulneris]|uniref:Uncharacterized protein n=1 Tax=Candidozyma haemuli TaxID=45357 RepID=A0A2V1AVD2_9ASCO|nr:hypothetical protein CXQ85_004739 [[Candida] haemuloni]KAF3985730.1 hypothetical protein FT662_04962 [[Candida] haemuloni var. vulneris]KAF3986530.1 hypothetical protein FT663_04840 [[Candida] haemuloni var. vulneris]PVH22070.1 hypothetical protein CXQ85_004739 [[Candida] haemuloni]
MSPPFDVLLELPGLIQPHATNRKLYSRVVLVVHRPIEIDTFTLNIKGVSKLTSRGGKVDKEEVFATGTSNLLTGRETTYDEGTYTFESTFMFADIRTFLPSQQLQMPDGVVSTFEYVLRATCKTVDEVEMEVVRPVQIRPALQDLSLDTEFFASTETRPPCVSTEFTRTLGKAKRDNIITRAITDVPFRIEFAYNRKYPDLQFTSTDNVYYQKENLADFIDVYIYTPFSKATIMKSYHGKRWRKTALLAPTLKLSMSDVNLKQRFVREGKTVEGHSLVYPLLERENYMAVGLEKFEEVKRTFPWTNVKQQGLLTDYEYRFKLPNRLLRCCLDTSAQSYYNKLLSSYITLFIKFEISFLPDLPDQSIELESRILLLPQDRKRLRQIEEERGIRWYDTERPTVLPPYTKDDEKRSDQFW